MLSRTALSVLIGAFAVFQLRNYYISNQNSSLNQIKFDDPTAERTLKRALVIFRHGDRGPNEYTSSIQGGRFACSNATLWPDGCGELTTKGKLDAFHLGRRLRHRYNSILSENYSKSNVKATSTMMGRTLMSASLVSAGLYFPPKGHQVWHESIPWHPVPVFPNRACNMSNSFLCPSFATELTRLIPQAEKDITSDIELMKTLKEGGFSENDSLMFTFSLIHDFVFFAERNGIPLEAWQRKLLTHHNTIHYKIFSYIVVGSEKLKIINAGPQVEWIARELSADPGQNFTMYSGHDLTLLAVMSVLGVTSQTVPYPTSCLAIELHEVNGQPRVKVFYYEEARGKFTKLKVACEDSSNEGCNYNEFIKLVKKYSPENYDEICKGDKNPIEIDEHVQMFLKGVRRQFTE